MKWHDAREVIPEPDRWIILKDIARYGEMLCAPMGEGWINYYGQMWDFVSPYWCYVEELLEELDSDD